MISNGKEYNEKKSEAMPKTNRDKLRRRSEKSSSIHHVLKEQHSIDQNCLKLVGSINNNRDLCVWIL